MIVIIYLKKSVLVVHISNSACLYEAQFPFFSCFFFQQCFVWTPNQIAVHVCLKKIYKIQFTNQFPKAKQPIYQQRSDHNRNGTNSKVVWSTVSQYGKPVKEMVAIRLILLIDLEDRHGISLITEDSILLGK